MSVPYWSWRRPGATRRSAAASEDREELGGAYNPHVSHLPRGMGIVVARHEGVGLADHGVSQQIITPSIPTNLRRLLG